MPASADRNWPFWSIRKKALPTTCPQTSTIRRLPDKNADEQGIFLVFFHCSISLHRHRDPSRPRPLNLCASTRESTRWNVLARRSGLTPRQATTHSTFQGTAPRLTHSPPTARKTKTFSRQSTARIPSQTRPLVLTS